MGKRIEIYRGKNIYLLSLNSYMDLGVDEKMMIQCGVWINDVGLLEKPCTMDNFDKKLKIFKQELDVILDGARVISQKEFKKEQFKKKSIKILKRIYLYPIYKLKQLIDKLKQLIDRITGIFSRKEWNSLNKFDKAHHRLNNTKLFRLNKEREENIK